MNALAQHEEKPKPTRMSYLQAKYLKHAGAINDTKVSLHERDGIICIHIQDFEFETFESALRFLQEDSRSIVHQSQLTELEVAI